MRLKVYRINDKKLEEGTLIEESVVEGAITLTWVVIDSKRQRTRCAVGSWKPSPLAAWEPYVASLERDLEARLDRINDSIIGYGNAQVDFMLARAELTIARKDEANKNNG